MCPCRWSEEARTGSRAFMWTGWGFSASNPTLDTRLHHPEKPFEFYHLAHRKKLTPEDLGP